MCYRCQKCNAVVPHRMPCIRVVTKWREKHSPYRPKANPGYSTKLGEKRRSGKGADRTDDPGGLGKEIAKECAFCPDCANRPDLDLGFNLD